MPFRTMHLISAYLAATGTAEKSSCAAKAPAKEYVQDMNAYLLGAVSPDSPHFRPDFTIEKKEASHLWAGGPRWGQLEQPELWKARILDFWQQHRTDPHRDFYAGYCAHLLTDLTNDLRIWTPARVGNLQAGNLDWEGYYRQEFAGYDAYLYHTLPQVPLLYRCIRSAVPMDVPGMVRGVDEAAMVDSYPTEAQDAAKAPDVSQYRYCKPEIMQPFFLEEMPKLIRRTLWA